MKQREKRIIFLCFLIFPFLFLPLVGQEDDPSPLTLDKIFSKEFQAKKAVNPYHTSAPTTIDRKFQSREMQEKRVKELLLSSQLPYGKYYHVSVG